MGHRSCRWIARILGIALGAALAAGVTLSPAPPPAHAALEGAAQLETHRIRQGDTLFELLVAAGASPDDADSVGRAVARVSNPRRIPAGREIRFLFEPGESERRTLFAVSVEFGPDRFVEVIRDAQGAYRARLASVPLKHAAALMAGSPANDMVEMRAAQNETIGGILLRQGLPARAVDAAVKALRTHFDPRTLMPGQRLSIRSTSDSEGELELGGFAVHLKGGDEVVAVLPAEGGGFVSRRMSHTAFHAIGEEREPAREAQPVPSTAVEEAPGPAAAAPPDPVPDPVAEADTGLAEERITLRQERTLTNLLLSSGVERAEAAPAARSLRRVFDRRTLPVGTAVDIARQAPEGATPRLVELRIALQDGRIIEIERRRKGRFESRIADAPAAPAIAALPVADAEPDEPKDAPAPTLAASSEAPPEPEPASPLAKTRIEIRAGDTLMAVLREQGIDRLEADRAIRAARKRLNLKRLGIGQEIILWTDADETGAAFLQGLAIRTSGERYVRVIRASATSFEARHVAAADLRAPEVAVTATPPQIAQRPTGTDDTPASPPEPAAREVEAAAVRGNGPGGLVYKEVVLGRGDTLFASLKRAGGSDEESEAVVAAFRKIHDPRRLQIGQTLSLLFESGPEDSLKVARLALNVAPDQNVVVVRDGDSGFLSRSEERTLHRVVRRASGAIQTSLYEAAVAAGVPVQVLTEVIHILSFDVDFQREIQRGKPVRPALQRGLRPYGRCRGQRPGSLSRDRGRPPAGGALPLRTRRRACGLCRFQR